MAIGIVLVLLLLVVVFIISGFRIINAYERAVRLRLGKYHDTLSEGLKWIIPLVDQIKRIDMRQTTLGLPAQKVLSKDNVNLAIDGVVFYVVNNARDSFLNVENLRLQLENKASSELKEIIGGLDMNASLTGREKIAGELRDKLNRTVQEDDKPWGITVKAVQINDISLPEELIRAMAAIAEAQREREARVLKATGEQEAATKFAEASKIYGENPLAIRLRELQTYTEIGRENNSLVIVAGNKEDELLAGSLSHRLGVIKRRN